MVNHLKSPLWLLWMKHLHAGLNGRLTPEEWKVWFTRKVVEWKQMKADGLIDVEKLSIRKPYKCKPGRKRGRRKEKKVKKC